MTKREAVTTAIEIFGGICIVVGIGFFNVPISVIVLGVLLVIGGGLAA
jgi:hypothetical protein